MKNILMTVVMLGLAGGAYAAELGELAVNAADLKAMAAAEGGMVPTISRVYVAGDSVSAGAPSQPIEWVTIKGGKYMMGAEDGLKDARPVHAVDIKYDFDMAKTAVTVEQYAECWSKGECSEPGTGDYCNWGEADRQLHPINCVDWDQANQYARFISKRPGFEGARLPSESEWEYAAKSGGREQKYPWGDEKPTCGRVVMVYNGHYGCGNDTTRPVCTKTDGNTAQGLCDMAGNVWQLVQDKYQGSYNGVPADGSAFEGKGSSRVMRGGSFFSDAAWYLRADGRDHSNPNDGYARRGRVGFRLARYKPVITVNIVNNGH
jgi:formylglycine-generating enzyme required for sulfatase activity